MSQFRVTGRFVLFSLIGFFLCIIAANAAFITLAIRSFPGEQVEKSYFQGLRYNDTLAARRAQGALGWKASIAIAREGADARIRLTFRDRAGAPLHGLEVEGLLARAADNNDDRAISFEHLGEGVYSARVEALPDGLWRFEARAKDGADASASAFAMETKINIK